jgi:xanthine dehydrogenase YagS FAD-binding subunit
MATIRGMMPAFELFQPTSIEGALTLLERYRGARVLAGGLDTLDSLYDRVFRPSVIVDLGGIPALSGIRNTEDGLEIGATTTLTQLARHPAIAAKFDLLARAADVVGSPQIRNQGTIGGNVSQAPRCWYFRNGWTCYRGGGNICYADTPTAVNREHAIFASDRCVAVNASDVAPALVALDAKMVIRSTAGERIVAAEDYFLEPANDITRTTVLGPGDLLTAIRIPNTWGGASFYFEKARDRKSWDFALVNIASAIRRSNGRIDDIRLVANAVAARPLRLHAVEDAVRGKPWNEATALAAGELATRGASPLRHNGYKVPLLRNLVHRAIRGGGETWAT